MERIGLDLLLFRWFVCVDDPRRSPRALKELEPTSKARLAPTFLAAVLSQPWPLLLRHGPCRRPPLRETAFTGPAKPLYPAPGPASLKAVVQRKIDITWLRDRPIPLSRDHLVVRQPSIT